MYALIMAGGPGTRLGIGEKPLVTVAGVPMVMSVISAFRESGCDVVVVLTGKTPYTHAWCRAQGVPHYTAQGTGYIGDIREAAGVLEIKGPFFTSVADLPCLEKDVVETILSLYEECRKPALSVWVPRALSERCGSGVPYVEKVGGVDACPAGINIMRGDVVDGPQEEARILIDDERLAFNINTRKALRLVTMAKQSGTPAVNGTNNHHL